MSESVPFVYKTTASQNLGLLFKPMDRCVHCLLVTTHGDVVYLKVGVTMVTVPSDPTKNVTMWDLLSSTTFNWHIRRRVRRSSALLLCHRRVRSMVMPFSRGDEKLLTRISHSSVGITL